MSALRFADKTFMGFISGKLLDSAIIGVLCYIGCVILKMPYALLISVIVGVTNIIPFFGPFIGAIPSALLILLVDPKMCLWFVIFVFILQQLDGNVIGPKILGTSIGINGFWVLFSIVIFRRHFSASGACCLAFRPLSLSTRRLKWLSTASSKSTIFRLTPSRI